MLNFFDNNFCTLKAEKSITFDLMKNNTLKIVSILLLWLLVDACQTPMLTEMKAESVYVSDSLATDSAIVKLIAPYRLRLDSSMKEVIGYSEARIEKGSPESLLGNFLSDALFTSVMERYADTIGTMSAMSLLNNGGIRSSLPMGEVTIEHIFSLMPFDNEVVLLEISGEQMKQLLDVIASKGGMPVAGLRLTLQSNVWTKAVFTEKDFDQNARYMLITSDYLANGGDALNFLADPLRYIRTGWLVRDVFIEYIKLMTMRGEVIHPVMDGRIRYE